MYRLPNNVIWTQKNNSDLLGDIEYSKNINLDENGYLKLSQRAVSLINAETDANFEFVSSFGKKSDGVFYLLSTDQAYILTLVDNATSSLAQDAGTSVPSMSTNSYGKWWRNLWHVTTQTKLWYKTPASGDWTDSGITLTTGKSHPICAFDKANTLMVANGNLIQQLNSSYATTSLSQLTLSTDYEIIGLAYNNNLLGIATRMASTVAGQGKDTQFFTWDGSASSANAGYGVGSDTIVGIIAYKSSFVILNRSGQLLYFNGGGFDILAEFPFYFKNSIWGSTSSKNVLGDMMRTDGERIYINVNSSLTTMKGVDYIESFVGGVWCYDKDAGLYHRYSPSLSSATILGARQADVNTTTDVITVYNAESMPTSPTIPSTGNPIRVLDSSIAPLVSGNVYYIIKASATTFKLASTYADAIALNAIDLTSTGGSYSRFLTFELKDYGQSRVYRQAGIGIQGYKANSYTDIIFSGQLYDTNSITPYSHLNILVDGFKNIGYFITSKKLSGGIEDIFHKINVKYRPLKSDDQIILKYKNKDTIGLPEIGACSATSNTVLTSTDDFSKSYAFTGELECEVISGAGSGQMVKVTSIGYSGGTYTITLSTALEGVSASDNLSIKLDNWVYIATITSSDSNNWVDVPIVQNSKWIKMKVILVGSETTVEELQIINEPQVKSA